MYMYSRSSITVHNLQTNAVIVLELMNSYAWSSALQLYSSFGYSSVYHITGLLTGPNQNIGLNIGLKTRKYRADVEQM